MNWRTIVAELVILVPGFVVLYLIQRPSWNRRG